MHQPPNAWMHEAVRRIERDFQRSADTHLLRSQSAGVCRSVHALPEGRVHPSHRQPEAPVGTIAVPLRAVQRLDRARHDDHRGIVRSTAIREAYFARLLGLPFVAVMPRGTSAAKVAQIEFYGGTSHFVDVPADSLREAERLADELGGHYMDQFTYAERATDWRGNNNIAESIFAQMAHERAPGSALGRRAAPAPAARRPRLGATSATAASTPSCASSTRSIRSSTTTVTSATRRSPMRPAVPASRASVARESSRPSCRTSSTACCACRTRPPTLRCGCWPTWSAASMAARPGHDFYGALQLA